MIVTDQTNNCSTTSVSTTVTVNQPPEIITQPLNEVIPLSGNSFTFSLTAEGESLSYQWYKNNIAIDNIINSSASTNSYTDINGNLTDNYYCIITNGYGCVITSNTVTLTQTLYISGYATYDNSINTPLQCITVYLVNSTSGATISYTNTDINGYYEFDNVEPATYTLEFSNNNKPCPNDILPCNQNLTYPYEGSDPNDALAVNNYYIHAYSIQDNLKKKTADVNEDGEINPIDALLINRRFILINHFILSDWIYESPIFTLTVYDITENIHGICAGDVLGQDKPEFANCSIKATPINPQNNNNANNRTNSITSDSCFVSIDSVKAKSGDTIKFALKIKSIENEDIGSFGFHISFDSTSIKFIKVENVNSDLSSMELNKTHDSLHFAWDGMGNTNFLNDTKICDLKFLFIGGQSTLSFLNGSMVGGENLIEFNVNFINGYVNYIPREYTKCEHDSATFSIKTVASNPISFQWYKNDSLPITNATDSIFTIKNLSLSDSGMYYCVISNSCGNTTSDEIILKLNAFPFIVHNSSDTTLCAGASTSFSVNATGTQPLSYKWLKNGDMMTGDGMHSVITNTLILDSITTGNAGEYIAIVSNSCGSMTSDTMNLTVNTPPLITSQSRDTTLCVGASTSLSVHAIGTVPLTYSWYKNGDIMPSVSTNTLILDSITTGNAGNYSTIVSNNCGSTSSDTISLVVQSPPNIQNRFDTITTFTGDTITLYANVNGAMPQYYQWQKEMDNGELIIDNATSSSYSIDSIKLSDAGVYSCNVSNMCGNETANIMHLYVDEKDLRKITQQNKPGSNDILSDDITVNIYPNPNDGSFILDINTTNEGNIEIGGYDVLGRKVLYELEFMQKGENVFPLRIINGIQGIYFINIRTDRGTFNKKMIIR